MSEAVAIIVGATISASVAVLVVAVQHSLHLRHERRSESAARLSALTSAGHAVAIRTGKLARAPLSSKEAFDGDGMAALGERFNSALAAVLLLDNEALVRAAFAIDRELVQLLFDSRSSQWTREEWATHREDLSRLVDSFQQLARQHLGARALSGGGLWAQPSPRRR